MAEISAQLVKQLRDRTGAGMMDAKKALVEADGDIENAIDVLRTKGIAKAAKKGDRDALAGVIGVKNDGHKAVIVEINSETDFVARNAKFQEFAKGVIDKAFAANGSFEALMTQEMTDEVLAQAATIGEKLEIKRADVVAVENGAVISYIHNKLGDGIGLIGVILGIESTAPAAAITEIGDQVAMHIAAAAPIALDIADVPAETVAREEAIAKEKAIASGKPADIAEKMVGGAIRKYYDEVVLNEQGFFIEPAKKVKDVVRGIAPDAKIVKFVRFQIAG